ncbi:MAG: AmmeMemoRadiSam system radical SAM enzyme [Propionibacteriaceae bacterium]|jgi:pyruvate formate lyase activating enzyme|nr:AmmeMemoRadiSam system radical SAM enzyme [Propionibacteriaceae bacterium]
MRANYWHPLDDGRLQCDLCPRHCRLRPGQRGFCFVRENQDGQLVATTYGRSSGFALDPIEKKPLYHVAPGSAVFSFGTAGCNLACKFCQNWSISTARSVDRLQAVASPAEIAASAARQGASGVAYTYNDPVIFAEYAIDTALACRERGLLNIAVTAGFVDSAPRADFFAVMDAANVDLKSFNPDFYRRTVGGRLEVVLDTLRYVAQETDCWLEVTTLLIPGLNDSDGEIGALTSWVAGELGVDVPIHFSAFHPANRMRDLPVTQAATVKRARQIGLANGLRYVYTGNVVDLKGSTTSCPACGEAVVERQGYRIIKRLVDSGGCCHYCGTILAGRWAEPTPL